MALVKVIQAYRFALEPTPAQERALRSHAGAARFAWNWGLARCKERYEAEGKWYSAMDLHKLWNAAKKADPALAWWGENSKCSYQESFRDLDRALHDFIKSRKGETVVEVDEAPRRDTSLEQLAKLPPIFVKDGSHTAGNAPGVNDGAGALVVASEEWAKKEGRRALATVIAHAQVADDFPYLARTPANATKAALAKAGLDVDQVDLFEINEAFASVALNSMRMLGVDEDKVNVNGGAIALGHPIGASGARILGALVHELRRRGGGLGVAAICSGGGQGDAVVVEVNGN